MIRKNNKSLSLFFMFALFALAMPVPEAPCSDRITIAVLEFTAVGVEKSLSKTLTELVEAEVVMSGRFRVLERSRMNEIFNEIGLQQTGCTEVSCAVKVGQMLSAQKVLAGSVIKVGGRLVISAKMIDIEKGEIEFADKKTLNSTEGLDIAAGELASSLIGNLRNIKTLKDYGWKCLAGDCITGEGAAVNLEGTRFEGQFRYGNMNGTGTLSYKSGARYSGDFKDNMYHGFGTLIHADGSKYVGNFKENMYHGDGILSDPNGNVVFQGKFENDKSVGCCLLFWRLNN